MTLFKQGPHTRKVDAESIDEEKVAHAEPIVRASADASPADLDKPSAGRFHLGARGIHGSRLCCRLLYDVSGYVAPGKLTALMGGSGAGKVKCLGVRFLVVLHLFPDYSPECLVTAC